VIRQSVPQRQHRHIFAATSETEIKQMALRQRRSSERRQKYRRQLRLQSPPLLNGRIALPNGSSVTELTSSSLTNGLLHFIQLHVVFVDRLHTDKKV